MWCYRKPGFEALLLAELQRQQQCSQFCDTLLKTDGVSVPAHSCVLSAISPHFSSALSSTPLPPAGQSRLLEFRALGGCTLLHLVRLLYCGEMAGEGEKEKQEAISAAAKLGIHGLVEVMRRDGASRREEDEGRRAEVGVQTEPEQGRWRREVRDGSTFLWKETLSESGRDAWTQTEELQMNVAPPPQPVASYETIDITALQGLGQTDPNLLPTQIPYVPLSLVYPVDENQMRQPSSAYFDSVQESTAAGHTSVAAMASLHTAIPPYAPSFSGHDTVCAADPQRSWAGPQDSAEDWEDDRYEQFQGNIPGYIMHFLDSDKKAGSCRGRPRGRRGTGVGGARRGGAGERRARRPRGRAGGRGRGGLTQTVDVQEVGVSKLQMLFLKRGGVRATRTGQGGGAAGRNLHLKTRELLKPAKSRQRRRGGGKVFEFSPSGDLLLNSDGRASNTQRGRRIKTQQFNPDDFPAGRPQRARAKPPMPLSSFSSPPLRFHNLHTSSTSSSSLQPSPSPRLRPAAASFVSPASSLIHTTTVPPAAPPPPEEQPDHIDRFLEEVMMGLDILPNSNSAPHPQPPLPASRNTFTSSGNALAQDQQQGQVVAIAGGGGGSSSADSEVAALQQQGEGELNEILEHFLQSFEQHVDSFAAREETETGSWSSTTAPVRSSQATGRQHNETRRSQPHKASSRSAALPKHTEKPTGETREPAKRRRKKKSQQYMFSLEKKRVRVRTPVSSSGAKTKMDRGDKLQQMPVVKLERSGPLPVRVNLQGHSCLEVESLANRKTSSSSVKDGGSSGKNQPTWWSTKTYPIRSRLRDELVDCIPFLEEPLDHKRPTSVNKPGRRRSRSKKDELPRLCNGESSIQLQSVKPCGTEEQAEEKQEQHEENVHVQPPEEAEAPQRGGKRAAEPEEETSDHATKAKRICFEQMQHPVSETLTPGAESPATETDDVIDVETVSLCSLQKEEEKEEKTASNKIKPGEIEECSADEEMESSDDEIIDVEGDTEEETERSQSRTATALSHLMKVEPSPPSHSESRPGSTGSWDEEDGEDIDVIGGSSPAPDPVIISWTDSSEEEEEERDEDVDVVEEKTDYASSVVFAAMSGGELCDRNYQAEVLLH